MNRRGEIARNLTIFALCAPTAVLVWVVFHLIYTDLTITSKAVGYVDSGMAMLIAMGYIAMVGGTIVFAGIAAWTGFRALQLWLAGRRRSE
jgi:hypothetical protein